MEAWLKGLETRAAQGLPLDRVASVASFFISRVESATDKAIDTRLESTSGEITGLLQSARSQVGNAKQGEHTRLPRRKPMLSRELPRLGCRVPR
jgi:transaldolase